MIGLVSILVVTLGTSLLLVRSFPVTQLIKNARRMNSIGTKSSSYASKSMAMKVASSIANENSVDVVIVGGGIAGLSCASNLCSIAPAASYLLLESNNRAGGRVGSDYIDGYTLDKGFQVFIDSYPEAKLLLDYDDLQLGSFLPGAKVRLAGEFGLVSDPFRRPQDLISSLVSPVGSIIDKVKVC